MTRALSRVLWAIIGVALLVLPALPLATWSGAPDSGPVWEPHLLAWVLGIPIVLTGAWLAGRMGSNLRVQAWKLPAVSPLAAVVVFAVALTALSAVAMVNAFAQNPHLVDEVAQLFQARVFAAGRLAAPVPEPPEFFLVTQTLMTEAGWVSQYPPGQSLLLALGFLVGAEWLINPVLGGVGVVLVYAIGRGLYGPKTGVAASFLWAVSAWVLFMSATYMNHVGAVTFALAAWAAVWSPKKFTARYAALAGLLLAATAAMRPLDAVTAAIPIAVWLICRRRFGAFVWIALGSLPVAFAWGYVNARLYGSPFTLGYTALYGAEVGLGFGMDPWGRTYTPLIALSNAASAIRRLHIYFYEWPIPALLPLALWALVARPRALGDLVVAIGMIAGPALYFFYWHSGFYPGPRFYYIAAPFVALGMARAWRWIWNRAKRLPQRWGLRWDMAVAASAVIVLLWGWADLLPARWHAYRAQLVSLKRHPERELAAKGIMQALVIVPESWSSRIVTNLWGLGAPPGLVERAFNRTDTCDLHEFATRARQARLTSQQITDSLTVRLETPDRMVQPIRDWPDPTVRLRTRDALPRACRVEMNRDLQGFAIYGHLAWHNDIDLDTGLVFARDLYELNHALFARYPEWPVWRYAPLSSDPNAPPVLTLLAPDTTNVSQ